MTKLLLWCLPLTVLLLTSCEKEPGRSDLSSDFVVQTNFLEGTDFSKRPTYFLGDTVFVIGSSSSDAEIERWPYDSNDKAKAMLDLVNSRMDDFGYTAQSDTTDADLRLQITYIENLHFFHIFPNNGPWWDYWGHWNGWHWGWFPHYPFRLTYVYRTGSVIIDMIDNKAEVTELPNGNLVKPVIWNAYGSGLKSSNNNFNQRLVLRAIDQAFNQSEYLNINKNSN